MEYFVDEMPRDCASCKHYHMNCADGYSCSKLRKEIHPNFSEGIGYRHQDCPLQSLTDYTKQVRKEVCEKIKKQIFNHFNVKNMEDYENLSLIDGLFTADAVIEMLDTILKEYREKL